MYLCTTYIVSIENSLTLIWTEAKNLKENTQKIITIFKKTKYKCIVEPGDKELFGHPKIVP